jgi:uncharacterized protein
MVVNFRCIVKPILAIAILLETFGCSPSKTEYELSIDHWHQLRIDSLKGETGFLNLAGLFWLNGGVNSFGSDSTNDFYFTSKSLPQLGSFLLKDSIVYLITQNDVKVDGKVVSDTTLVFSEDIVKVMKYSSLRWFIIKRGDQMGVRLRDFQHSLLTTFDTIDYFTTNPQWKVDALWKPYVKPRKVEFANVIGMAIPYEIKGAFQFKIDNVAYALEPLGEPGSDGYFIMFYDKTSGHSTYGSGRYLYVEAPDSLGNTFIDFNKAYNPPCAFTEFATCLFPHTENRLPFLVNAGEKFSEH